MFYLKYRPQTITELDNKKIRESLGQALLDNNFVHAYLLVGPKGTGKTTTARLIAKIVNCQSRKKGEEPCNKCDSCQAITKGSSLDVIEIDAASNTGVDDIRDLREKAKLFPTGSKYKVYIIDEVHMLSTSAFNALLKILEEPPEHVIFVLATTEVQKLPPTVISRCLVYNFGQTSKDDVFGKLKKISSEEKMKIEESTLLQIVEITGTSHRDAQKLLEQMAMGSDSSLATLTAQLPSDYAEKVLKTILASNAKEALELVNKFVEDDGKIKDLISGLVNKLRDNLLSGNGDRDHNIDLINKLIVANAMIRDCPIPQLPLEMVIIEYCAKPQLSVLGSQLSDPSSPVIGTSVTEKLPTEKQEAENKKPKTDSTVVIAKWPEILTAVKSYNHSLVAFLRASRPTELVGDYLTLEVFYKFHKERLEELKNREILEKVVSGIMGQDLKVKFVLAEKGR